MNNFSSALSRAASGALVLAIATAPAAAAPGVSWMDTELSDAIDRAKETDKRLLVNFTAQWCSVCKVLKKKLLSTSEGARLTRQMLAVQVDFDDVKNRSYVEKYVILGLPTTVVLKPDGTEAGRIMGFDGKEDFTKRLEELQTGEISLVSLQRQHTKHPHDPSALRQLGQALLERGAPARGQALLERVTWLAPRSDAAAHALFVLGRYTHRVKRDPETARHVWRELASRFSETSWAGGAWWWYARAQAEIGRPLTGAYALQMWSKHAKKPTTGAKALRLWGLFVSKHALKTLAPRVLAAFARFDRNIAPKEKAKMDALIPKLKGL